MSFDGAVGEAQTFKCAECGEYGASVRCSATACRKYFHLPCTIKCKHDAGEPPNTAAQVLALPVAPNLQVSGRVAGRSCACGLCALPVAWKVVQKMGACRMSTPHRRLARCMRSEPLTPMGTRLVRRAQPIPPLLSASSPLQQAASCSAPRTPCWGRPAGSRAAPFTAAVPAGASLRQLAAPS